MNYPYSSFMYNKLKLFIMCMTFYTFMFNTIVERLLLKSFMFILNL